MRIAVVVNPCRLVGPVAGLWSRILATMSARATIVGQAETSADGAHVERIRSLLRTTRASIIVAAGGDGTVSDVGQAVRDAALPAAPVVAIMPLGTANNVARSLGLQSFRQRGEAAVAPALAALFAGQQRAIDLGRVGNRYFVGSFSAGMDADILVMRNRIRRLFALGHRVGGYPLYLACCAANVLSGRHGGMARLRTDGNEAEHRICNLLVTNTPIYAGEFRLDADNACDDGRLDLHVFCGRRDYLRRFSAAWRRHVRYSRGDRVYPPPGVLRVRDVRVEFPAPVAAQLDGEAVAVARAYDIQVVPRALTVCVPPR